MANWNIGDTYQQQTRIWEIHRNSKLEYGRYIETANKNTGDT